MKNPIVVLLLGMAACCLSACGSPHKIKAEHRDPDWHGGQFKNILVIGIYDDRGLRISSESVFAAELTEQAVTASPSYDLIPDLETLADEEAVRKALDGTDYDAILTVMALDGRGFDYSSWEAQYAFLRLLGGDGEGIKLWRNVDHLDAGAYILDVGLWDPKTLKPVWNATTDLYSHERASEGVKILADFMIKTLKERGLI